MERPLVGIAVIIKKGKEVLIGKRKNILGHGNWAFPGGHLEHGENLDDAVSREVMEEVGIKIKNIRFQRLTNDIRKDIKTHYITLFFTCDFKSGKVRNMEPHKCEGWKWIQWSFLLTNKTNLFLPIKNLLKQKYSPF